MRKVIFDLADTDHVIVYEVPEDAVIREHWAESDAEAAALKAGTYPPLICTPDEAKDW